MKQRESTPKSGGPWGCQTQDSFPASRRFIHDVAPQILKHSAFIFQRLEILWNFMTSLWIKSCQGWHCFEPNGWGVSSTFLLGEKKIQVVFLSLAAKHLQVRGQSFSRPQLCPPYVFVFVYEAKTDKITFTDHYYMVFFAVEIWHLHRFTPVRCVNFFMGFTLKDNKCHQMDNEHKDGLQEQMDVPATRML